MSVLWLFGRVGFEKCANVSHYSHARARFLRQPSAKLSAFCRKLDFHHLGKVPSAGSCLDTGKLTCPSCSSVTSRSVPCSLCWAHASEVARPSNSTGIHTTVCSVHHFLQLSERSAESSRHLFYLRPRARADFADCLQKLWVRHGRTQVGPALRLSLDHAELLLFRLAQIASGSAL